MTFSSAFWTKFLQVLAAVRGDTGLCCCEGRLLDKALLVLALGVDRGLRLVDLLAARQGEGSKEKVVARVAIASCGVLAAVLVHV